MSAAHNHVTLADGGFEIRAKNRGYEGFDFEHEGHWNGPFSFIQSADTQFGMIDSYVYGNKGFPNWDAELELTRKAIDKVNQLTPRPRFFVVCGDLVDGMPGVSYKAAQITDFKKVFSNLHPDIRLVCVCGNHDVGDLPTSKDIAEYRRDFGDDYFSFWVGGVKFIVLNAQLYHDYSQAQKERREQDAWLDQELSPNPAKPWRHLVGLQHIPPFVRAPDEDKVDVPGNDKIFFNFADRAERAQFLQKIKTAGMSKLFCGHYHRNAGGWDENLEVIVTSAVGCQLGNDKSGLRIVNVLETDIKHRYFPLDLIPSDAILKDAS